MKHTIFLAIDFAKRDFTQRYVGTSIGQFWYILSPLVMIFIYTVVFSNFMKMKLDIVDSSYAYSIYLVPGLLSWNAFSTLIMRLSSIFEEKAALLKKINVPMHVFMLSYFLTEFLLFIISIILSLIFLIFISQPIGLSFFFLIPLMATHMVFAFSLGVIVALFVPFLKDIREAVPIILQLCFWATPIVYMAELLGTKYSWLITFNPFGYFSRAYQNIYLFGKIPSFFDCSVMLILTGSTFIIAGVLYKKMIGTIKDII
jgi:lipopolysaccharide transport system permease protein